MTTETAQVFTVELNQYGFMTKEQVEQIAAAIHTSLKREYGPRETRQERIADWLFHGSFDRGETFSLETITQEWQFHHANPWSGPGRENPLSFNEDDD